MTDRSLVEKNSIRVRNKGVAPNQMSVRTGSTRVTTNGTDRRPTLIVITDLYNAAEYCLKQFLKKSMLSEYATVARQNNNGHIACAHHNALTQWFITGVQSWFKKSIEYKRRPLRQYIFNFVVYTLYFRML